MKSDVRQPESDTIVSGIADRTLLLVWQDPMSRKFSRVGRLDHLVDGRYAFEYNELAQELPGFFPLAEFPTFEHSYVSKSLPAFFANRVMSRDRASYSEYRSWLGLKIGADTPMEVLARTGGNRATDTFHLVDAPTADGELAARFFVSGISHVSDSIAKLSRITAGDSLEIRAEPNNPVNERALLVDVSIGEEIGWVPDWLVDEVHFQRARDKKLEFRVERVNADAPDHLKLLAQASSGS